MWILRLLEKLCGSFLMRILCWFQGAVGIHAEIYGLIVDFEVMKWKLRDLIFRDCFLGYTLAYTPRVYPRNQPHEKLRKFQRKLKKSKIKLENLTWNWKPLNQSINPQLSACHILPSNPLIIPSRKSFHKSIFYYQNSFQHSIFYPYLKFIASLSS